ncbi:adenosylcobinamide-GDP ribazoletransferase [Agarivorans sp. TSD2052]|uniref:adenosylcobinamide-GDP ribazoletransferase n=1 Tax=Agarivorans sp. TSD2052 TaxID=2937286 RepID=UPI00200CDD97|nr:adenosylcobinamide-GDP ribazoletransferase [Agarivorans sp. TSD2052]UPW17353.1 adenosylcobinamide-GDP ribazoletransferase [Agarivorans sp. TSD2052]
MKASSRLKQELNLFFNALSFFSRVPVPAWVEYSATSLSHCVRYFPLVGWFIGLLSGLVIIGLMPVFGAPLAVLLSMVISCWATGAFHEDGFADCCDGFGGGYSPEQILMIMKDSRLGTYGVLGLCCMLAIKFTALLGLSQSFSAVNLLFTVFLAHTLSRFSAVLLVWRLNYIREPSEPSKAKAVAQNLAIKDVLLASVWVVVPALMIQLNALLVALVSTIVITILWARYLKLKLGGYTGDTLGAQQQLNEVGIYLSITVAANLAWL